MDKKQTEKLGMPFGFTVAVRWHYLHLQRLLIVHMPTSYLHLLTVISSSEVIQSHLHTSAFRDIFRAAFPIKNKTSELKKGMEKTPINIKVKKKIVHPTGVHKPHHHTYRLDKALHISVTRIQNFCQKNTRQV